MNTKEIRHLGIANSWRVDTVPKEVLECDKHGHKKDTREISRGYYQHVCQTCKISFNVDSGG